MASPHIPGEISPLQPRLAPDPVDPAKYDSSARLAMPNPLSGMAFVALTPSSHTILVDTDREHGGTAEGPEPLELLLLALGSCTGMDVISILRKKRQKVTHYSVNVHAQRAQEYPRTYTEIVVEHVVSGDKVDPAVVARSIELSITKYCPVHALLSRATRVEHAYRVLDAAMEMSESGTK